MGHFTSGGSEANYTALLCALTDAAPGFATDGARAFAGPPVFYVSRESHLAWLKIAHQAGIGRSAVRLVATDGAGRMDPRRSAAASLADRAGGRVPVMIVATAGTTNAGMIDPLVACAASRERTASGTTSMPPGAARSRFGSAARLLDGIELADSVTIDAHKWFATTMGCGMFLTRARAALSRGLPVSQPPSCRPTPPSSTPM